MEVALKEEKSDKNKKILKFEFEILKDLQGNDYFFLLMVKYKTISFCFLNF